MKTITFQRELLDECNLLVSEFISLRDDIRASLKEYREFKDVDSLIQCLINTTDEIETFIFLATDIMPNSLIKVLDDEE